MKNTIRDFFDLYNLHRKHGKKNIIWKIKYFQEFKSRHQAFINKKIEGLKVLDVGCGKTYPFSYLFSLEGCQVIGLDTQYIGRGPFKYIKMKHYDGLKVSFKTLIRDLLFTRKDRKILSFDYKKLKNPSSISFIRGSAEEIPVQDNSFDIIFSYCTLEHIFGINKALSEIFRVAKKGGIIYITYHPFTSISGGHHNRWFWPEIDPPNDISPWFHLRNQQNKYISILDYGLNGLRLDDYRKSFNNYFSVFYEFSDKIEGKKFLTEEIRKELIDYSEEELLVTLKTIISIKN